MSLPPPSPNPLRTTARQAEDAQRYRTLLHNLMDMGAAIARRIHDQVMAQPEPQTLADAQVLADTAIAFDRVARTVRRTVMLARKLDEPVRPDAAEHRTEARKRIIREVEDAIDFRATSADYRGLVAELHERLDSPELDEDIDTRLVADIIADICRDLWVVRTADATKPWKRRYPEEVRELCERAAAPRPARPAPVAPPRNGSLPPPRLIHPDAAAQPRASPPPAPG